MTKTADSTRNVLLSLDDISDKVPVREGPSRFAVDHCEAGGVMTVEGAKERGIRKC
jgi:hypothetical protein